MGKTNKYFRSVFSIKPIATFSVIAMILAGVFYLNMTSNTGKLWGIERSTVYTIIYALVGLTQISIYYFNVKKSGWLLAIISLIIQTISAVIIAPFLILYLLNKMMNTIVGSNSDSTKSVNSTKLSINVEGIIKPVGAGMDRTWEYKNGLLKPIGGTMDKSWEYKNGILKPVGGTMDKTWEYKNGILKPVGAGMDKAWEYKNGILKPVGAGMDKSWEYKNGQLRPMGAGMDRSWEVKGNIPIPVVAKVIGIIK